MITTDNDLTVKLMEMSNRWGAELGRTAQALAHRGDEVTALTDKLREASTKLYRAELDAKTAQDVLNRAREIHAKDIKSMKRAISKAKRSRKAARKGGKR